MRRLLHRSNFLLLIKRIGRRTSHWSTGSSLRFRVQRKEIPQNIRRYHTRVRIEVRIKRHLAGNVHRVAIPFMNPSDQLVELYFGVATAMGGIFLNHSGDVTLAVAQGGGCIES